MNPVTHDDLALLITLLGGICAALIGIIGGQLRNRSEQKKENGIIKAATDMAVVQVNGLTDRVIELRQQLPDGALFNMMHQIKELSLTRDSDLTALAAHQGRQDVRLDRSEQRESELESMVIYNRDVRVSQLEERVGTIEKSLAYDPSGRTATSMSTTTVISHISQDPPELEEAQ